MVFSFLMKTIFATSKQWAVETLVRASDLGLDCLSMPHNRHQAYMGYGSHCFTNEFPM